MANELVVAQVIPSTFILPTEDLVLKFHQKLLPFSISNYDLSEIMTQISENIDTKDKQNTYADFRKLPHFDRIVSRHFLGTIERQHLLKAAVFELACGVYEELEKFKVFDSHRFRNKFPYAFEKMIGQDVSFFHIPY